MVINPAWFVPIAPIGRGEFDTGGRWQETEAGPAFRGLIAPSGAEPDAVSEPATVSLDRLEIYTRETITLDAGARLQIQAGTYAGVWEVEGTPAKWPSGWHIKVRRLTNG
ncbi:hypothetical protein H8R18_01295 [Nanchangia anserum]|uniref:Uncharacterized protein n=1 Tax=Nanchangia anserum TaxID=2692125 RepID=A0A8I0KRY5_9ACTO|nr:hypothetical protein [Nanchangia anserum]MBD3689872.1 hypothetical protein [Nanchangia anserum]QOX82040.1 hypothetical protein H8R18_01295 [Nanchangia anserum]